MTSENIQDRQRESFVCIIRYETATESEKIEKELGPYPRWKAEKVDGFENMILDLGVFYTMILTREGLRDWKKERGIKEEGEADATSPTEGIPGR